MSTRDERGRRIAERGDQVRRTGDHTYTVNSQSSGRQYVLLHVSSGWICQCPDHMLEGHRCKHMRAAEIVIGDRARADRGGMIFRMGGQVRRIADDHYLVNSQRSSRQYGVVRSGGRWRCACPDHLIGGSHCKHIYAVEIGSGIREPESGHAVIGEPDQSKCKFCDSPNVTKKGLKKFKKGTFQNFRCGSCRRYFVNNLGFERKRATPEQITMAVEMVFGGMSTRKTAKAIRMTGTDVSHMTVLNWVTEYARLMDKYMDRIVPQVGEQWRTDEIYMMIKGNRRYLFAMMDAKKRFWLAQMVAEHKGNDDVEPLFEKAKEVGGKVPTKLISDGADNFHNAWKKQYRAKNFLHKETVHERHVHIAKDMNNNQMESFNGNTVRLREVTVRGLKREDSAILTGLRLYHNFVRPHLGLPGNITPGEAAGIHIEGDNKWKTIIQNAARQRDAENKRADEDGLAGKGGQADT